MSVDVGTGPLGQDSSGTRSSKGLVLIVEDNEEVRTLVAMFLRRNGFAVTEAADGVAGLEAVENLRPNLVLLDVLLPHLDGIEFLKRLRSCGPAQDTPVVMMSAVLQVRDLKAETDRLNVASIIQKPFQLRTVLEHIEAALNPESRHESSIVSRIPPSVVIGGERRIHMNREPLPRRGSISDLPVPEIIHALFVRGQTGKLTLSGSGAEKRVFFQSGMPVYAESSIPEETLGAHLLRVGRLTQEQHDVAVAEMTLTGRHFGEVLLKLELIGPHDLFTELEAHLTQKVFTTFAWHKGDFQFEEGDDWKDDVIVARMKPGRITLDGVQRFWNPSLVQKRVRITDRSRTFPLDSSMFSEEQMGMSTQEMRILQLVRRGLTVGEIIRQTGDLQLATTTLYGLYVLEHAGFVLSARDAERGDPTPRGVTGGMDEKAKGLLAEYIKYRTADYFKLLGVTRDASDEEIQRAFFDRRQRYHPDAFSGMDAGLVHEKIEELYVRLHNAYRILSNPETKAKYLASLEDKMLGQPLETVPRGRTGRYTTSSMRPADVLAFEEGFAALRAGDHGRAAECFQKANEIVPKPRYEAYHAWAEFLQNPLVNRASAEQTLQKLAREHSDEAQVLYLLGNLCLRNQENDKAISYFERTLQVDDKHIDAARQLRLLRMRQRGSEASGLFDLFKKK
ncbi:MAG: response regulator [Myxococcota bacterium]|jgi:CheY-like chemotaxis protein/tetratricopeptide (TPR) repeat protein|nr:response regulator [Myxococcota bacterium]